MSPRRWRYLVVAAALVGVACATKLHRPWTPRVECDEIFNPRWPSAYAKSPAEFIEPKGRTASSLQHLGYTCVHFGAATKCYLCEPIVCGDTLNLTCPMQIQGMDWTQLPKNIPSVSDVPFAAGPAVAHRNDFGAAQRTCVLLSGDYCINPNPTDPALNFTRCSVRCWGQSLPPFVPIDVTGFALDTLSNVRWDTGKTVGQAQGRVGTLAGAVGVPGFADGAAGVARFRNPTGVAVDAARYVYIADTGNHAIRRIAPDGSVTTVAGTGAVGHLDGPAATATFSAPEGVALYYSRGALVILVADTQNHCVRMIKAGVVSSIAGNCTKRGYADGVAINALFDSPHGIAVDDEGYVFVADTGNHLVRVVSPYHGYAVTTLAGNYTRDPWENPGCPPPCLVGVSGYRDGNLTYAQFAVPVDVAVGPHNTVYVSDEHRIRRVTRSAVKSTLIQGVSFVGEVSTIAGTLLSNAVGDDTGKLDGLGYEATLNSPWGVIVASDESIYVADTTACRIRRISSALATSIQASCFTRPVDVVRPSGCASYEEPVDAIGRKATPMTNNIYYNYGKAYPYDGWHIKDCIGVPPPDRGIRSSGVTAGPNTCERCCARAHFEWSGACVCVCVFMYVCVCGRRGTQYEFFVANEETGDQTTLRVLCPPGCGAAAAAATPSGVIGTDVYADTSVICASAVHAGAIPSVGGLVTITMRRGYGPAAAPDYAGYNIGVVGSLKNGILSTSATSTLVAGNGWNRVFTVAPYNLSNVEVQTIAGIPNAPLDDPCGHADGVPPQEMRFKGPHKVSLFVNAVRAAAACARGCACGELIAGLAASVAY